MMNFNTLTSNLMVEVVDRTIAFYEKVLGFDLQRIVPENGPYAWASMKSGEVEIMFQRLYSRFC